MTAIDTLAGKAAATAPRLPRMVLKLIARWRRHRRAARIWLDLSRLDDRLRHDLGLDFTDLASLRHRAHGTDPTEDRANLVAMLDLVARHRQ